VDDEAEAHGELIIATIRDIRREKNRQGIPLNAPLEQVSLYASEAKHTESLVLGIEDISATMKSENVEVHEGEGGEYTVEGYEGVRFSFSVQEQEG
jgi:valyl-tRNA synthetase